MKFLLLEFYKFNFNMKWNKIFGFTNYIQRLIIIIDFILTSISGFANKRRTIFSFLFLIAKFNGESTVTILKII